MRIRVASTPQERRAVYRFRYQIYVELEGRAQHHANHRLGTVEEPLDEHAFVLAAFDRGEVVGTVRTNLLSRGSLGHYDRLYGIDALPSRERFGVSITTKLMVAPSHRGSGCALRLSKLAYRLSLEAGARWDFVDSRNHTLPLFRRLGYRVVRRDLMHPEYGLATLLRLDLHDADHLRQVRSPFLSTLQTQTRACA